MDARLKAGLSNLSAKIKSNGFVELEQVKVFEFLSAEALKQFPLELKPRTKTMPVSPIFDFGM